MTVLSKLNQARKLFHGRQIKKTGHNKFADYKYFELGDFLIPALEIFGSLELSAIVSFGVDLATMTLTDLEDGSQFFITSPMSTAKLKACHEVQNLGAVQTYIRRYLWVAALEIVEHDAIDSSPGASTEPERITNAQAERIGKLASSVNTDLPEMFRWISGKSGRSIKLFNDLTPEEAALITRTLESKKQPQKEPS